MGNGGFIDSTSSDLTFSAIHSALGKIKGLEEAGGVEKDHADVIITQLQRHQMIGESNDLEAGD